ILAIQDIRSMQINSRWNYIMGGVVACMVLLSHRPILYIAAIILMTVTFPIACKSFFAKGDIQVMSWQILGLGILGPTFLYLYWILLPSYLLVHTAFRMLYHIKEKTAGIPILAATFWTIAAVYYIVFVGI
ncbi:MAG: hypothetical protein MUP17_04905, partial [candidate division Zixibacteria bacterium]|nr:hypothetical protein [candidate division Zixibacteria bacterium]